MTETPRKTGGRARRYLLVGSLALNLLVIAAVTTAVLSGGPHRKGPQRERDLAAPYIGAFDIADKRAIRTQMRARMPERDAQRALVAAEYQAFLALLRSEPFDAAAAATAIERQLARSGDIQRMGRALAVERLAQMSPAEREAYAQRFEERIARGAKGHRKTKP